MTTFRVTNATSLSSSAASAVLFDSDSAAADAFIVDLDAFLVATGPPTFGSVGARLGNAGAWTVTINGSIHGAFTGLELAAGNTALSKITIGREGSVSGPAYGAFGSGGIWAKSAVAITNYGLVSGWFPGAGGGWAVFLEGAGSSVRNYGEMYGGVDAVADGCVLLNSGTIAGPVTGFASVTNSGSIIGSQVHSDDGQTNKGNIVNTGYIAATDFTLAGTKENSLLNSGLIDVGTISAGFGGIVFIRPTSSNVFSNGGTINGDVYAQNGVRAVNQGTINGIVYLQSSSSLTNSGRISGAVLFNLGHDTFTNSGSIDFEVDLAAGNDSFFGGASSETVVDGSGSDYYALGGGADRYKAGTYNASDGLDTIDGGTGIDTYDASMLGLNSAINLDSISHNWGLFGGGGILVAANTTTGGTPDIIKGFENAIGGAGQNDIHGTSAANKLEGRGGIDRLFGYAGSDTLDGGSELDVLVGGLGADLLTGGAGNDFFSYASIKDSGITRATRDRISDFTQGQDLIDLELIDANTANGSLTNEDFKFIGTNVRFSNSPGELRSIWMAGGQLLQGDVNGDSKADFSIFVSDPLHSLVLSSADFYNV